MKPSPSHQRKTSRPSIDWQKVRAEYEAGGPTATFAALGKRHGVSHTAVRKRSIKEKWTQDLEPVIQRRTAEMVSGVVSASDPKKRDEAVTAEASRRAQIEARHRTEWTQVAALRQEALSARGVSPDEAARLGPDKLEGLKLVRTELAFAKAKLAKITAEITAIQQAGERRAHRLGETDAPPNGAQEPAKIIVVRGCESE